MKYWRVTDASGDQRIVNAWRYHVDEHNNLIFLGSDKDEKTVQFEMVHKHDWRAVTEWDAAKDEPKWHLSSEESQTERVWGVEDYINYEVARRLKELGIEHKDLDYE